MNFLESFLKKEEKTEEVVVEEEEEENDDDPRLSSAALCMSFFFGNDTTVYGPEFTHQCYEGEKIAGYQPFPEEIEAKQALILGKDGQEQEEPHASFKHHESATEYLKITAHIAPSCAKTQVSMEFCKKTIGAAPNTNKENNTRNDDEQVSKRRRLEDGKTKPDNPSAIDSKMAPILEALGKMLPEITTDQNIDIREDYIKEPMGVKLMEYSRNGQHFVITLCQGKDKGVSDYHNQVQKLALPYIEAADPIDVTYQPHGGSYWQIAYLFEKLGESSFALCGYFTLWTVTSPFHKPVSGRILRITQALILPSYQRQGHGKEMMRAIYDMAQKDSSNEDYPIVQVNVEDPAEGFMNLRDLVDFNYLKGSEEWHKELLDAIDKPSEETAIVMDVAAKSKLTSRQVKVVLEVLKWKQLQEKSHGAFIGFSDPQQKFRLEVKARLYQENKAAICSLPEKTEMQTALQRLYDEVLQQYNDILKKS